MSQSESHSWKNELADKLLNLTNGLTLSNFAEAISIMKLLQNNTPTHLYRYRGIKSDTDFKRLIEFLDTNELYCSKHSGLNDPFDLRSPLTDGSLRFLNKDTMNATKIIFVVFIIVMMTDIHKKEDAESAVATVKTIFDDMGAKGIDIKQTLKEIFSVVEEYGDEEPPESEYLRIYSLLEQNKSFDGALTEHYFKETYNTILEALDDIGVACFSESSTNMPMWWHYADERKGICLEFDIKEFHAPIPEVYLMPVNYTDNLPDLTSSILEKSEKLNMQYALLHVCMHKQLSWNYEREWRVINFKHLSDNSTGNLNSVKFIKPKKIILGDKMEDAPNGYKEKIVDKARVLGIEVTQMEIRVTGYSEKVIFKP